MKTLHKIDFLACERHNYHHLLPIWQKIPDDRKGLFHVLTTVDSVEHFSKSPASLSFHDSAESITQKINAKKNLLVTSSFYDAFLIDIERPLIFISHGGGQTYLGQYEYHLARKNYVLDLLPNHHTAKVFDERYPQTKKVVIGSPKLDAWHGNFKKPQNTKPVIAFSFHFDRKAIPESRTAWPHFQPAVERLANQDKWKILGHGHPRMMDTLCPVYEKLGIEIALDFDEVMDRADLYICDNSSTLYEFASTNRPVVVLNAPWYRRDVEHGLRFWEYANVGVNCDHPEDLIRAIEIALLDPPEQQEKRKKAVQGVYVYTDGKAALRAAEAILSFSEKRDPSFLYPGIQNKQIKNFLNTNDIYSDTISSRITQHKIEILKILQKINNNLHFHLKDLEFHVWGILLLLIKTKNIDSVNAIYTQFNHIFTNSEILNPIFKEAQKILNIKSKNESILRIAKHYVEKGDTEKAKKYLEIAKNTK